MIPIYIHIAANGIISFFFMVLWYPIAYVYYIFFRMDGLFFFFIPHESGLDLWLAMMTNRILQIWCGL